MNWMNLSLPWVQSVAIYGMVASLVVLGTVVCVMLVRKLLVLHHAVTERRQYCEIIPPASAAMTAETTGQLLRVLHGTDRTCSLYEKMIGYRPRVSMEIVATKQEGIRYIIGCSTDLYPMIIQEFKSYMMDSRITETVDPYRLLSVGAYSCPMELRQQRHFALPLTPQHELDYHDPLAYLTGNMTSLDGHETMIYQLVIVPRRYQEVESLARKILVNDEVLERLMRGTKAPFSQVLGIINNLLFSLLDATTSLLSQKTEMSSSSRDPLLAHRRQVAAHLKPHRVLSRFEEETIQAVHGKLADPLFQVSLRTLVVSPSRASCKERTRRLRASMALFSTAQYQALVHRSTYLRLVQVPYRLFFQRRRLSSVLRSSSLILSSREIADLYHFPYQGTNTTEDIAKSFSRALPAPLSLKSSPVLDVVIGNNVYHGTMTPIGLTQRERERHMYIIGGTGNGKTTLVQGMAIQDICQGKGVAVVDPHGDMARELLAHIPDERIHDVIYLNPDDLGYPIGLNLLEIDPSLSGDELLREKDLITESVVSIFRKIFSEDDSGGHRIEYILRNAVQTALTIENATLFTIYDLLNNKRYLKTVLKTLDDNNLKNFWENEIGKAGDMQRVKMMAGITAKIGRFLFSASARRILEQSVSTINFEDILNSNKILICNFSKGLIGEDTSGLFGTAVLAKLQLAAMKRARKEQQDRTAYYVYVDEFQNFATISFVQMLSEARKYKLFITMAEQSTSQQEDVGMVNTILANAGTVVCFRTGSPVDEQLILPLFQPHLSQGEIASLPSYHFYAKLAAVHSQEPLSGVTVMPPDGQQNPQEVIESSRRLYGMEYSRLQNAASSDGREPKSGLPSPPVRVIPRE